MKNRMHRPLAAVIAILGVGSGVIFACSEGPAANEQDAGLVDAGPQPDAGPRPDSGTDAKPDEYTVDIGAGFATACALSNLGHVKCWGDALHGDMLTTPLKNKLCYSYLSSGLTDCDSRTPTDLPIPYPVEQLVVGHENVCVIANDDGTRKLFCWGDTKDSLRLSSYGPPAPSPVAPPGTPGFGGIVTSLLQIPFPAADGGVRAAPKRVTGDEFFKIVELTDGTILGWGDNQTGQYAGLVLKAEVGLPSQTWPILDGGGFDAGGPILDVTTQYFSSFFLTAAGIYGTGDNQLRQQMQPYPKFVLFPEEGDVIEYNTWTRLPDARNGLDGGALLEDAGADPIAKLFKSNGSAGSGCYITVSGKLYCWGSNESGQIGTAAIEPGFGKFAQTPTQVALPAGRTATQVVIAPNEACAITDDGAVYCWGDNTHGALAQSPIPVDEAHRLLPTPQLVPGVSDAKAVAVGTLFFACVLTGDHKTSCWGDNGYGQRGTAPDGGDSQFSSTPNEVPLTW